MNKAISPVIDDKKFIGSDSGLPVPIRRTALGAARLAVINLDKADPPSPYVAGGVPREKTFNRNILSVEAMSAKPGADAVPVMPEIEIAIDGQGFDAAATPILWRLQTLYAVGRYQKVTGGSNPHYRSRVLSLDDGWTGEARSTRFKLFADDANVAYDNFTRRVAGGHAILSVAINPPSLGQWLQDYVHIRINGKNPDEEKVRKLVDKLFAGRTDQFVHMANAVFKHENSFKQFDPGYRTGEPYSGVQFDWPHDPASFTSIAFDYGIGIGQYTHPGSETVGICWDWTENVTAGINELLEDLRSTFHPRTTWREWAKRAWATYNAGSATSSAGIAYANKLLALPDGQALAKTNVPEDFDFKAQTQPFPLQGAPPKVRDWPTLPKTAPVTPAATAYTALVNHIVETVSAKQVNRDVLCWLWPKIEDEVVNFTHADQATMFPDLGSGRWNETVANLDAHARSAALNRAFDILWEDGNKTRRGKRDRGQAGAAQSFAATGNLDSEWTRLSAFVRANIDGGIGAWAGLRERLFAKFGAANDPDTAIPRINRYYATLIAADFPLAGSPANGSTPVHPVLRDRLAKATALLTSEGQTGTLALLRDVAGLSIRNNINSKSNLSNHSFGWAVDLDAILNPNTARSNIPLDLIEFLTGLDLYGPVNQRLRTPRAYRACLADVRLFTDSSSAFKECFRDATHLAAGIGDAITRLYHKELTVQQLATLQQAVAKTPPDSKSISQVMASAGLNANQIKSASQISVKCARLEKDCRHAQPKASGNAARIAAYGFVNLAPELIAALIASDGGALVWLGAATGTKDMMHFELSSADRPPLK